MGYGPLVPPRPAASCSTSSVITSCMCGPNGECLSICRGVCGLVCVVSNAPPLPRGCARGRGLAVASPCSADPASLADTDFNFCSIKKGIATSAFFILLVSCGAGVEGADLCGGVGGADLCVDDRCGRKLSASTHTSGTCRATCDARSP